MFAKIKQVAVIGAVVGAGWMPIVSPAVAHTQPTHISPGDNITCPSGADAANAQYLPDPEDSNAYYVCAGGVEPQHIRCPSIAKLIMSTPPKCSPRSNHHNALADRDLAIAASVVT
ncbi:hypothetical protein [Mycobacterium sp.]|uniref:hypothetical protein n=1 Tax=Mycobacterium sp. TaxID=1785 RepID=UPI0025E6C7FA|nr:hypothetical protein [Mycobacterium sp.]